MHTEYVDFSELTNSSASFCRFQHVHILDNILAEKVAEKLALLRELLKRKIHFIYFFFHLKTNVLFCRKKFVV